MIQIDKKEIAACCGKKQITWKISTSVKKEHLPFFQEAGFSFLQTYLDAGMLHIEDNAITVTGVFGQTDIRIKCKNSNCEDSKKKLEEMILTKF